MNVEKLPSGNYRISQMVDGKRYRTTIDHKPSKVEAMKIITDLVAKRSPVAKHDMTVLDACNAYLEAKSNVLSPSTLDRYKCPLRAISEEFGRKYIMSLTAVDFQREVNRYAQGHAPKTVSNFTSFLSATFKFFNLDIQSPTKPKPINVEKYIPTPKEVNSIIDYYKGTKYEIFYRLATYGVRRSEIFALTVDDLNGDVLTINKAKVKGPDGKWVIKSTKTTKSDRAIVVDSDLSDMIRKQGYIWKGSDHYPYEKLRKAQDALGIHPFGVHTLRHFMASYLHHKGFSDKQIQAIGGWSTDHVMKAVYLHEMEMEEAKKNASLLISDIFTDDDMQ